MQWLNYHHLYYFRAIANAGGITKAALKLNVGQPTLSAQLKQLEDMIGKPLFERRNRRLQLTEAGKAALDYANEIFRLGDEMIEVLQDRSPMNQLHLQIGALDSVPKNLILALVTHAYRVAPCTVSILEGKGPELFRELHAHRIDLILSNYPAQANEGASVFSKPIAKLPVSVYSSKDFTALKRGFPKSLEGRPFILPTVHSKLRHDLNHYFKTQGVQIQPLAETQDTSLQKLMTIEGLGFAPLSDAPGLEKEPLYKIGRLDGVFEEFWLIAAHRKLENPVAAELIKSFALTPRMKSGKRLA